MNLIDDLKNRLENAVADCNLRLLENNKLQQRIDKAIELVENVYNSLENVDRPIMFYENILEILKGDLNVD